MPRELESQVNLSEVKRNFVNRAWLGTVVSVGFIEKDGEKPYFKVGVKAKGLRNIRFSDHDEGHFKIGDSVTLHEVITVLGKKHTSTYHTRSYDYPTNRIKQ